MNLLKRLRDSKSKELTFSKPGGWWIDNRRLHARTAIQEAQQWCLIRKTHSDGDTYVVYSLSEDGNKILEDPAHQPCIVDAWRKSNSEKKEDPDAETST